MNIKIHKLDGCELLDYRKIQPLQDMGDSSLKDLTDEGYGKLKASLIKHGFTFPGFVWKSPRIDELDAYDYYAIDMHQRLRVMLREDMNDKGDYDIPVVYIPAANEAEAKEKLLLATSQFGKITYDGMYKFVNQAHLPEAEIYQAVQFDALPLLGKPSKPDRIEALSIVIYFNDKGELENCLSEIEEVCERYDTKGINVKGDE